MKPELVSKEHRMKNRFTIPAGPFEPNWESLSAYNTPRWYLDGKFGIFIHWGVYSIPGFGSEWYPRNMYIEGSKEYEHHLSTYGPHSQFGYKDFIPQFLAERFDPDEWAEVFRNAGARFVVPVAEHHDGFCMYDSALTDWCSSKMGPNRDIIGELADAVRRQWMVFGVSSHRAEHWWFMDGGMKFDSDVRNGKYGDLYGPAQPKDTQPNDEFLDDWLRRTCELVDKYQPQIVWFDWWIEEPAFRDYLKRFAAYYYNRGHEWDRGVAINYKNEAYVDGTAVFDVERGQLDDLSPRFWQTDTAVAKNSWGYINGLEYKTPEMIIGDLIDIVSKNGALLLNIGPRPDGSIPDEDKSILAAIGDWLTVNGSGIYDSRPWRVYGEGPTQVVKGSFSDTQRNAFNEKDFRFTRRDKDLYAFFFKWPESGDLLMKSLGTDLRLLNGEIKSVALLAKNEGGEIPVTWSRRQSGLRVSLPETRTGEHAWTLKISLNT
jgi:alpha-L-fucosidase